MRFPALKSIPALVAVLGACTSTPAPGTAPVDERRLLGAWTLTHVGPEPVSRAMTLEFRRDRWMVGRSRCNGLSGAYEIRPPAVVFPEPVIITTAGCAGDWPSNREAVELAERVLFADPPSPWSVSEDGRRLYVHGRSELRFAR